MDIKETLEVLVFVEAGLKKALEAASDGKISLVEAIKAVPELLPKVRDAFIGIQKVKLELADLDSEEVKVLLDKCLVIFSLIFDVSL